MKTVFFALAILLLSIFLGSCKTKEKGLWVFDQENLLTNNQVNKLDSLYKTHEKITSNQIALFIVKDYFPDTSIMVKATELGNIYGVGLDEKDNGVVILLCTKNLGWKFRNHKIFGKTRKQNRIAI